MTSVPSCSVFHNIQLLGSSGSACVAVWEGKGGGWGGSRVLCPFASCCFPHPVAVLPWLLGLTLQLFSSLFLIIVVRKHTFLLKVGTRKILLPLKELLAHNLRTVEGDINAPCIHEFSHLCEGLLLKAIRLEKIQQILLVLQPW